MHPVLCMESRAHNVAGLPGSYDTEQGREAAPVSILFAHEFLPWTSSKAGSTPRDPARTVLKLNEADIPVLCA